MSVTSSDKFCTRSVHLVNEVISQLTIFVILLRNELYAALYPFVHRKFIRPSIQVNVRVIMNKTKQLT